MRKTMNDENEIITERVLAEIKYYLENEDVKALDLKGDVNGDGKVDEKDLKALKKFLASADAEGINLALADVNGDGEINFKDVAALKKAIAAAYAAKGAE